MSAAGGTLGAAPDKDAVNRDLLYHGRISRAMTAQRTALESALIPVTAYILVSGVECYRRYPAMMREIAAAMPPEDIGRAGRQPGTQVDPVHLWSAVNIPLVGRQVLAPFGMTDPEYDLDALATIFDFWRPAARAFRADGHLQAWDGGLTVPRYDEDVVEQLSEGVGATAGEERRAQVLRLNATLTSFLFLLYFDTRAGYQDTGPYELDEGRVLLVRDFNEFGVSHFPWSKEVCADLPYSNLTAAFVLDGVHLTCNDWGTSVTQPADYFPHVLGFGLFDSTGGELVPVPFEELDDLTAAVKQAQKRLYRLIAGMSRKEKIDAGAYVYFTFLHPFARVAGVADRLDWTVPRDSLDVYEILSMIEETPAIELDESIPYYVPIA
jgi:hypothetical protein